MEPALSLVSNEVEVPEKYMDVISYSFAYDPVRLPLDQDPTQNLYDRKTLETIWETKRHAHNPFTKQWFSAKSVIPQRELRQEMEDYIKLQKLSGCTSDTHLEVIEEYTKFLEEGEMRQYLDILGKSLPKKVTAQQQCLAIWKKINVLRLYFEFDYKNIETFRSLGGFKYLNECIIQMTMLLRNNKIEKETKESAWNVCKEISRAIDVIGLKPEDIHDVERKSKEIVLLGGYIKMIQDVYTYNKGYAKTESLMLRIFSKIFCEINAEAKQILGNKAYEGVAAVTGNNIVKKKLLDTNAEDISSEDLYHGISIVQTSWITTASLENPDHSQMLLNAIIICIAREIDRSEEDTTDVSEAQLLEAQAEERHNWKALEKGLCLLKDILVMTEGPGVAIIIMQGGFDILKEIVNMFQHFTLHVQDEDENDYQTNTPLFCAKKRCKKFESIHSTIAQLGLDISTAMAISAGGHICDTEVLLKFLKPGSCSS